MSAPSTLAAERTQLARVRTVVAVLLTAAIVGRAALSSWPAAALVCLVVAVVAVASRLHRAPLGPGRAAAFVGLVVALAAVGLVETLR
ncbi:MULTISPECIES: DUF202 domain-containing protein [Tsukamurella]|uniref:DUF202 domain-containing protein n=2 Tax=Tsukamurella TaxID=2060 RepID=A0A5C5S5Z7_9ACTN|nr:MULTISPECIES: DUF202 domain-containing protein [Tsukamurella]NMD56815.1 DUF202 domain-containing protein [Tsukamurella columbiensis]TWS29721.1 DUF202 domain-containing protein [Tsukamurella conjunctivitidis]